MIILIVKFGKHMHPKLFSVCLFVLIQSKSLAEPSGQGDLRVREQRVAESDLSGPPGGAGWLEGRSPGQCTVGCGLCCGASPQEDAELLQDGTKKEKVLP